MTRFEAIVAIQILLAATLAATGGAQIDPGDLHAVAGERKASWSEGQVRAGGSTDHGPSIWNNNAVQAWWGSPSTDYINLDWGRLPAPSSGLADHIIDGFTFKYGTNNLDPQGEAYAIYFFDSCTGWGNIGIPEATFAFQGLPNAYGLPSLPPGQGWIWAITVDLEGSGDTFPLNQRFGQAHVRMSTPTSGWTGPALGWPPNMHGNGPTGTDCAFSIYFPNGNYNGTWWFGGYPSWVTWPGELFGTEGQANMAFYGVGALGNDASLYATGSFTAGGQLRFLLKKNGSLLDGHLLASFVKRSHYYGLPHDVTSLTGSPISTFPYPMLEDPVGDFCRLALTVPPQFGSTTVYFQGILGDAPLPQPPIDASNGLQAN